MVVRHGAAFHPGETRNASKSFIGSINYQRSNPGQLEASTNQELHRRITMFKLNSFQDSLGSVECLAPGKLI
uniref:Uncharacterized protein n=1 Tax=Kalanchoe fedtschenkoi TaxID=63787 RepID=A0A7N0V8W9_KALFE